MFNLGLDKCRLKTDASGQAGRETMILTRSGELVQHRQTHFLAFLRVKLRGEDIIVAKLPT